MTTRNETGTRKNCTHSATACSLSCDIWFFRWLGKSPRAKDRASFHPTDRLLCR